MSRKHFYGRWAFRLAALGLVAAVIWVWLFIEKQRQDKWIFTAGIGLVAWAGFLIWVLLLSRWRARARWSVFLGTMALVIFCRLGLRISGVTGDLLPIVEGRWTKSAAVSATQIVKSAPAEPAALTNRYPQFLGPDRNGVLSGPQLARDWKLSAPVELWRCAVGPAWSGFALEGSRAVTQEQRGAEELVVCRELATGRELWSHSDRSRYATTIAGEGPRATPTIAGDRVFTMGGAGVLNCLDLATGRVIWGTNTIRQLAAEIPAWGVACSPLVTEHAVIVTVGGSWHTLVAYDRNNGARLWAAAADDPELAGAHWSSPVRAVLDGVPQILTFNHSLAAHDERTGRVLWHSPWPGKNPRVSLPLVLPGDRVLLSTGYGVGAELLQVTQENNGWRATRLWKSLRMKSKFGHCFVLDGFLYGLDDGALACVDLTDGGLKWKGDRYGHGQMMLVGGLLLLMAESGEMVLLEPSPAGPRELSRFKVFKTKTWNPPALAGDLLVVRNDREAAGLRLPTVARAVR